MARMYKLVSGREGESMSVATAESPQMLSADTPVFLSEDHPCSCLPTITNHFLMGSLVFRDEF